MNKRELVADIAARADISKALAGRCLDVFLKSVTDSLSNKESLNLVGFGTFSVEKRAARGVTNPSTGERMMIEAKTVAKFSAGKYLKEAVSCKK